MRHTTPKIDKGICYGQADIALDQDLFEAELAQIRQQLLPGFEKVYASPLSRCKQLAQQLSKEVQLDKRLMELNFGQWENKSWNEINEAALTDWMTDFVHVKAGKGESYLDLHNRTQSFIEELLATTRQQVVIVTHAGNIRSFISHVLDLPLENSFRIQLPYGSVVHITLGKAAHAHKLHITPTLGA